MSGARVELGSAVAVDVEGRRIEDTALGGRVARRTLAVLALEQRPLPRDALADAVWGSELPRTWETALRGAIHRIRRAIGADAVWTAFGCYQLNAEVSVDTLVAIGSLPVAETLLRNGDPVEALRLGSAAARVLDQPFLPTDDGPWFDERRRELAAAAVRARLTESAAATAAGEHQRGIDAAQAALRHHRYQEDVYRRLMAAHAAAGNRAEALSAYQRCRQLLADELGVDPSPATESAYVSLLGDEPRPRPTPVAPRELPTTLPRPTRLCGRAVELAAGGRHLERMMAGEALLVVLVGGAGMGKSRLAAEIAALAHDEGASVVHGRFDPDAGAPQAAIAEAFGQLGAPWPPPTTTATGVAPDPNRLITGAAELIETVTAQHPLVMVIDDLHWADRASLRLLEQLVRIARTGFLILATTRADVANPALAELLASAEDGAVIDVPELDRRATDELVAAWAGQPAEAPLVDWLHARSGGNPFFTNALLHDLAARHAVIPAGLAGLGAPSDDVGDVSRLLSDVVARLDPAVAVVLDTAAIIGPDFRVDDLCACTGLAADRVLAALDAAARARLVGQSTIDPSRFHFTHALVREARLGRADDVRMQDIHAAAAEALARRSPQSPELVRHLLRSGRPGAIERAARVAVGANADLLAAGAPEISRSLLSAVIEAMDAAELDAPVERASTLAALASTSMALLDVPRAREQLRTAARIAIALNSPEVLKPVQATFIAPTLVGGVDDEMISLVQRLLDLAPAGTPLRVLLLCWLGMELGWTYDDRRLKAVVDEALDTARVLRDPGIFLLAANAWHFLSRFVHPAVRRDLVDEVLEVSDRLGEPLGVQFLMYRTVDSLELGDHHAAAEAVREAKERVAASHWSYEPWVVRRTEVMFATLEGRLDEADRLGDGFAAMTPPDGAPDAQLQLVVQTLVRRYHQGRLVELHPLVAAFAADEKAPDFARCVLAWIEVEIGAASASVALDAALAAARAAPRDLTWKLVLAISAEAAAGLGHAAADEIARMLEPWSSLHVITTTLTYLGAIDRYLALGAAAAGDLDRAVSLGERALDQHRGVGSPPYVARTAAELAAMLRRRGEPGDRDRADLLRAEARELAHHHGLERVLALTR